MAGPVGATGAKGDQGVPGPVGATGPAGKGTTFLCNATLSETVLLGISAGFRVTPETNCTGVLTTDILMIYPTSLASFGTQGAATAAQGYAANTAVHHAIPTAAGKFRAVISAPAIALGATYSIPVAVYAVNR